jgi:hypothetical protein
VITTEQNTPKQLQRLGAQRQLYATAKRIFVLQITLSGPVTVGLAVLVRAYPTTEAAVALWGFILLAFNVLWFAPWLDKRRTAGARIQEVFDCDVLDLPWKEIKMGAKPDPELVKEQSDKDSKNAARMPPLHDWYAPSVADIPLHLGRLVCQRSNCSWDAGLRRRYATLVIGVLAIICVLVLVLSLEHNYTLQDFLLKVVAPLAPALGLGYRQFTEQIAAAVRCDELKTYCQNVWDDALSGADERDITARSRDLQDEIFEGRRTNPPVFDWVYRWKRTSNQGQMSYAADDLVTEAKARIACRAGA